MNCIRSFLEDVKKTEDMCEKNIFDKPHYLKNSYEVWGGRLVQPLKGCLEVLSFPSRKTTWTGRIGENLLRGVIIIIGVVAAPFARLGLYLRKKGEALNPGLDIRSQISAKRIEIIDLLKKAGISSPLGGVANRAF